MPRICRCCRSSLRRSSDAPCPPYSCIGLMFLVAGCGEARKPVVDGPPGGPAGRSNSTPRAACLLALGRTVLRYGRSSRSNQAGDDQNKEPRAGHAEGPPPRTAGQATHHLFRHIAWSSPISNSTGRGYCRSSTTTAATRYSDVGEVSRERPARTWTCAAVAKFRETMDARADRHAVRTARLVRTLTYEFLRPGGPLKTVARQVMSRVSTPEKIDRQAGRILTVDNELSRSPLRNRSHHKGRLQNSRS